MLLYSSFYAARAVALAAQLRSALNTVGRIVWGYKAGWFMCIERGRNPLVDGDTGIYSVTGVGPSRAFSLREGSTWFSWCEKAQDCEAALVANGPVIEWLDDRTPKRFRRRSFAHRFARPS
jgi:hypothetical protein